MVEAEEMAHILAAPHVNFYDPALFKDLKREVERGEGQKGKLTEFLTLLALCHTVLPEKTDNGNEVKKTNSLPFIFSFFVDQ